MVQRKKNTGPALKVIVLIILAAIIITLGFCMKTDQKSSKEASVNKPLTCAEIIYTNQEHMLS
ncbi:MAG: hypothetical protein U9P80_05190, partial [Thermodesulfobacteriota bacterium]|nr:hypothetical protein [Thermodesulfobacteriota bacterium]